MVRVLNQSIDVSSLSVEFLDIPYSRSLGMFFSLPVPGGSRNRKGEVVSHEFTPEFQELWITHSKGVVGLDGQNQELAQPLNSACSSID